MRPPSVSVWHHALPSTLESVHKCQHHWDCLHSPILKSGQVRSRVNRNNQSQTDMTWAGQEYKPTMTRSRETFLENLYNLVFTSRWGNSFEFQLFRCLCKCNQLVLWQHKGIAQTKNKMNDDFYPTASNLFAKNKQLTDFILPEIELCRRVGVSLLEAVSLLDVYVPLLCKILPRVRHRSFKSFSDGLDNLKNTN